MTTIQTFNNGESGNSIRSKINTSLTNLNNDKAENSTVEVLETNLETQINTKVTNVYGGSNVSVNRVGNDVYVSSTGGGGGSGNDGAFAYYSITATQGQTILNIGFTYTNGNNNLFVFANGLKMQVGNDYTESSSTSITFNYGLNAGDIVQVIYPNKGLNWKGTYSGATAYVKDDAVYYNGNSYICKLANTGNIPTNTTYWDLLVSNGIADTLNRANHTGADNFAISSESQMNFNHADGSGFGVFSYSGVGGYNSTEFMRNAYFNGTDYKRFKSNSAVGDFLVDQDGRFEYWTAPAQVGTDITNWQLVFAIDINGNVTANNISGTNTGDQTITTGTITATEGQTAVTVGTHIVNSTKLIITLNGLEQTLGTDYTDTGATQITFTSGLLAGDKIKYKILS